jgi:2-dehydropantoate 2-reductase
VIGTLYAWALEKAGHSVEFYVRPGRAAEYGSVLPLKLYDARTKLKGELVEENWAIRMREDLPADHDYELILVSVQHYHFEDVSAFLGPRVGELYGCLASRRSAFFRFAEMIVEDALAY